ncbi:protein ELYS [Anabrus simplex]|uniref:protein ELYS n=1 Tax=Anabrus simplex TaxID=316456 RepID=UPI0034DCEEF1
MKVPVAPCAVSSVVPVTGINSTLIDVNNYELKGGLFKDVQYAWMSRGPFFTIVEVETGKRIASHCFCSTTADLHTEVMCVVELTGSEGSNKMSHCVLGIRCDVTRDMLCVFDINFSRVLRAINMPSRVLSLCVVEEGEIRYPISKTLWVMSGIIAVGLQDGLVLLVDLAKHEWEKLSSLWHTDYYDQVRGEQDPCSLLPLGVNEEVPNLEWKKSVARQSGAHLSLFLNGNAFIADEFLLLGPGGHTRKLLPKREVAVTSLMYIRRSISLVIGFSMSSFQIWNLSNLSLSLPMKIQAIFSAA